MQVFSVIGQIIVFLMLLFSIFLLTVKSKKKLANLFFALFLIVTAIDLSGLFLSNALSEYPLIRGVKIASTLLQMPLFYLYVLSLCYANFKIKIAHLLHAVLFFTFLIIFQLTSISLQSYLAYEIVGESQYVIYIALIFRSLARYRCVYLENYSNPDYANYKWLLQVTILFCIAHLFVLLRMALDYFDSAPSLLIGINIIISISALGVICWFVLKALYNPRLFIGVSEKLKPLQNSDSKVEEKTEVNIDVNPKAQQLLMFMETNKPYLDFDLTLQSLSLQIGIYEKELSTLINQQLDKHFYDFINEYRINDAKTILEDPAQKDLTILEILYKVGFNSKSSFYTAFKKSTNKTPTQYRKDAFSSIKSAENV